MKSNKAYVEQLFRKHYAKMFRLARTLLFDPEESKDAVSEVFAHLLEAPVVLLPDTEEAFLMRSVRNRCINILAHKSVKERTSRLLFLDARDTPADSDDEQLELLRRIISRLEPPIRSRIMRLRYLEEMSYQDIADALGVSKVTVYNHLSQAIDTVKQLFKTARQ